MNFKEFRKLYPHACAEAFINMKSDPLFWEAADEWDLLELGKRALAHLGSRKADLEEELKDEFDSDEAGQDVIRESREADAKEFNRKLS